MTGDPYEEHPPRSSKREVPGDSVGKKGAEVGGKGAGAALLVGHDEFAPSTVVRQGCTSGHRPDPAGRRRPFSQDGPARGAQDAAGLVAQLARAGQNEVDRILDQWGESHRATVAMQNGPGEDRGRSVDT